MKWVCGVLLLIVALLVWDGRTVAMIRFMGIAHRPSLNHEFENLEELLPGEPVLAEMRGGLPHPFHDKSEFARELWKSSNQSIHGYRFYQRPERPSAAVVAVLVGVLADKRSFVAYGGPKMCGGYHADFAVRLESCGESNWFLVCLGCEEVLIYSKDKELICDLEREAAQKLSEAWMDCQGVPFVELPTRLPIQSSALEDWGMDGGEAWNNWRRDLFPEGVRVRLQSLQVKVSDGQPQDEPVGEWRVTEETHDSKESALARVRDLEASQESRRKGRSWREGFAFGDKVYWVQVYDERALEEGLGILDRLRRYCEQTQPHKVRYYE